MQLKVANEHEICGLCTSVNADVNTPPIYVDSDACRQRQRFVLCCHACGRLECWQGCEDCPKEIRYAHVSSAYVIMVSKRLQEYAKRRLAADIRSVEAGGGGDCLFHSVVAALAHMFQSSIDHDATQHVLSKLSNRKAIHQFESKKDIVKTLRRMAAEGFSRWNPEAVFDFILAEVARKTNGISDDEWDPEALLRRHGFHCLFNNDNTPSDSVVAFGPDAHGYDGTDPDSYSGDAVMRVEFTPEAGVRQETLEHVPEGMWKFTSMRQELQGYFQILGNYHWGTQTDITNLCEALNIGVFLFCDSLQAGGNQSMYNLSAGREDYPYWIAIWWQEPVHFRLAEVCTDSQGFRSFWRRAEVPALLWHEYQRCNRLANRFLVCIIATPGLCVGQDCYDVSVFIPNPTCKYHNSCQFDLPT